MKALSAFRGLAIAGTSFVILGLNAQQLTLAEYYIDTDPGLGNGTPIPVGSAADSVSLALSIPSSGLSPGFHRLVVRAKDADGAWSLGQGRSLYVFQFAGTTSPQIAAAEYFIDDDPGVGNGTAIFLGAVADSIDLTTVVDVSSLPLGSYTLSVRVQDQSGVWSMHETQALTVCTTTQPSAGFSYSVSNGFSVTFTNASVNSDSSFWDFGTGDTTSIYSPVFVYPGPGYYAVCLTSNNDCGADTLCQLINVPDTLEITSVSQFAVMPGDTFNVSFATHYITFQPGNVFTLEATGLSGTFADPFVLGTQLGTTDGVFTNVQLPYNLPPNCYSLRLRGSQPQVTSSGDVRIKVNSLVGSPGNYALSFDGVDDHMDLGSWFYEQGFTVSFWVFPDSIQNDQATIAHLQGDLTLYSNPLLQNNYVLAHLLQFDLLPNRWNHVTITVDGASNTRKVYLFGQLMDENQWPYNPLADFAVTFGWGGTLPTAYFKGKLDEVKLWNAALTPEQVYQQVYLPLTGSEPGLLAYYTFDEGCQQTADDLSPAQRDAQLVGGAYRIPSDIPINHGNVYPDHGGNTNVVSVKIYGHFFQPGATVALLNATHPTIFSDSVLVDSEGTIARCLFDLAGTDTALYDVMLTNPDMTTTLYPQSFSIVQGTAPDLWVNIIGRGLNRLNAPYTFMIAYGNDGTVDAKGVPLWIALTGDTSMALTPRFDLIIPPGYVDSLAWDSIPFYFNTADFRGSGAIARVIPLYLPLIPAGSTSVLSFTISTPASIGIEAWMNPPYYMSPFSEDMKLCVQGTYEGITSLALPNAVSYLFGGVATPYMDCITSGYTAVSDYVQYWEYVNDIHPELPAVSDMVWHTAAALGQCALAGLEGEIYAATRFVLNVFSLTESLLTDAITVYHCRNALEEVAEAIQEVVVIDSFDPNMKIGPELFQNMSAPLNYVITFENVEGATADAQQVMIVDTLNTDQFDVPSFCFTALAFGDTVLLLNEIERADYQRDIDLRPEVDLVVRASGHWDVLNSIATWQFVSLDPITHELTDDPLLGFLPPNDGTGRGEGLVAFSIRPKNDLITGDTISNHATIIFDYNNPIETESWQNVIDLLHPISAVDALPPFTYADSIFVSWQGSDNLAGVETFSVFVSTNGSLYEPWLTNTSDTSAWFTAEFDSTYAFYTLATDSAGNVEDPPAGYDAMTQCVNIAQPVIQLNGSSYGIAVIPNPNDGSFALQVYSSEADNALLFITDLMGQPVFEGSFPLHKGTNYRRYAFGSLSAGLYSVKVRTSGWELNTRFVKE